MSEHAIRVLIADDQTVVREGLEMLLGLSPGVEVVGAAADIQGIRIARGLPVYNSQEMRALLRATGTAQASSPQQIGPLPDLRTAIDAHSTACVPLGLTRAFQQMPGALAPGELIRAWTR